MEAIETQKLLSFLPHRPPMVFIEKVIHADGVSGLCVAKVNDFCFVEDGKLRQSLFLEWMAQGHGYAMAAFLYMKGEHTSMKDAFLAAVSDLEFFDRETQVTTNTLFFVHTRVIKVLGPISLIEAEIKNENDEVFASANLKIYAQ